MKILRNLATSESSLDPKYALSFPIKGNRLCRSDFVKKKRIKDFNLQFSSCSMSLSYTTLNKNKNVYTRKEKTNRKERFLMKLD